MGTVKRRSAHVGKLVRDLGERGVDVRPRRIEGWTHEHLGPLAGTLYARQLEHFAALATLAASGRSADLVALRLAARGFACERLLDAIRGQMGLAEGESISALPRLDTTTGPSGDEGFAFIEDAAREIDGVAGQVPLPVVHFVEALRRNARRHAGALEESPELIFQTATINALLLAASQCPYDLRALTAVMGFDPSLVPVEAMDGFEGLLARGEFADEVIAAYRSSSPSELAEAALLLRTAVAEGFAADGRLSPEDMDWLAAVFSPAMVVIVKLYLQSDVSSIGSQAALGTGGGHNGSW